MWWLFINVVYIKIPQFTITAPWQNVEFQDVTQKFWHGSATAQTLKHCVCESQRCWMDGGGWRNQGQKTGSGLRPFMWRAEGWVGVGVSWGNEGGFECISRPCFHVRSAKPVPHQTHPNDGFKNKSSSTVIIHYFFLHMCVCVYACSTWGAGKVLEHLDRSVDDAGLPGWLCLRYYNRFNWINIQSSRTLMYCKRKTEI